LGKKEKSVGDKSTDTGGDEILFGSKIARHLQICEWAYYRARRKISRHNASA